MARLSPAPSRKRQYLILIAVLLLLAGGWIGFWKYAADAAHARSRAGAHARRRPAVRSPAARSKIGGFPFRFELICDGASAVVRGR
jgi:hypothetical protein